MDTKRSDTRQVGIWVRVSTDMQGDSPEHHERRARAYAKERGWQVAKVYRLEAVSGKSVKDLPVTRSMMEDIRQGRIDALIFSKLARLARNARELLDFADFFKEQDAGLISLQEAIDTSTPMGRMFYTFIAATAQWEREEISERVAASVKVRAQMGKPLGGQAPYGFRWQKKKLALNPDEAAVRRLMFELFLENGGRIRTVARTLNERGYRTRKGGKWTSTTVKRLLEDSSAKGQRRVNYTSSTGPGKGWKQKDESEWMYVPVPAIVDEGTFDAVNDRLRKRKTGPRPGKQVKHLFAGYIFCVCGTRMYVLSNTPKYVCQKCRNKVPAKDLEAIFASQLTGYLIDPSRVAASLSEAQGRLGIDRELLATLRKEEQKVREGMGRLLDLHASGEIPTKGFSRHYQPLEERLAQLQDEIPALEGKLDALGIRLESQEQLIAEAQDLGQRFPSLDFDAKRQVVENLVKRIEIGEETVDIQLFYLPFREPFALKPHSFRFQDVTKSARNLVPAGLPASVSDAVVRPTTCRDT